MQHLRRLRVSEWTTNDGRWVAAGGTHHIGADGFRRRLRPPELSGDMEMEWPDPPTKTDSGRKKELRLQQPPQLGACSKERVHSNPLDHHSLNEIETLCTPKTNQTNHAHLPNVRLTFLLLVPHPPLLVHFNLLHGCGHIP